ncbi:GTP cyclohydrolase II [Salinisphaera sp. T31B1]|uniref:GTP cyclohydrolase II n=1 Tax=Salinisphaera sp. T31B1 TaxID=727963 RepID=UPI00333F47F3
MRQVERAIFDLRRGLTVLIDAPEGRILVAPLEGLDDDVLARLRDDAQGAPRLVVSQHRLARLGLTVDTPAARLPLDDRDSAETVVEWACARTPRDTLPDRGPIATEAPDDAALTLMRRGLLIPAAVTAEVAPERAREITARVASGELLAIDTAAVAAYEAGAPRFLRRISAADVPLAESERTRFVLFREADGLREHVALVIGDPADWSEAVPVRLHSACLTGDLFGSLRCDCGEQLRTSVARISECGGGVLLYLAQEGRGIGLANKLRAYSLQDEGLDTMDADQVLGFGDDEREYNVALEMLAQLEIRRIELLTNNPTKIQAMSQGGVTVVQRSGIYGRLTVQNRRYLTAKAVRGGHWLEHVLGPATQEEDATPAERPHPAPPR